MISENVLMLVGLVVIATPFVILLIAILLHFVGSITNNFNLFVRFSGYWFGDKIENKHSGSTFDSFLKEEGISVVGNKAVKKSLKRVVLRQNKTLELVSSMMSDNTGLTMFIHYKDSEICDIVSYSNNEIADFLNDRELLESMLEVNKGKNERI